MEPDHVSRHTFVIGDWCVEPAAGRIVRGGLERRLRPQVMDLLVRLAARPGDVLPKSDLLDAVWGTRFVSESALTTAIAELREALEDDAKEPRFIQTVPKRGYRLVSPVSLTANGPPPAPQPRVAPSALAEPTHAEPALTSARGSAAVVIPPPAAARVDGPSATRSDTATPVVVPTLVPPAPGAADAAIAALPPVAAPPRRGVRVWSLAAGLVVILALFVGAASWRRPATVPVPPSIEVPILRTPGQEPSRSIEMTAVSPDGKTLVYAVEASAASPLMRRDLETRDVVPIPGTEGAMSPFFSPDGAWMGFWQGGSFRRMPARGAGADRSEPLVAARMGVGAAWRSNGDFVYAPTNLSGLMMLPSGGAGPRVLADARVMNGEIALRWPEALPDSPFVLFSVHRRPESQIQAIDVTTGERHLVVENCTLARFAAPDRLIYAKDRTLMAAPFDPQTARITGPAIELARGLSYYPRAHIPQFSVSAAGVLAYLTEPTRIERELLLVDRSGHVTPLGAPPRPYIHPRLSPDGKRIALWLEADDAPDTADVWTYDLATRQLTQQTTGGVSWRPVWSPDGQRLAYDTRPPTEMQNVFLIGLAARAGTPQPLLRRDRPQMAEDWLPDGHTLLISQAEPDTGRDLYLVNVDTRETRLLAKERADESAATVSPNGRWVAYVWGDSNPAAIYAVSTQADHPQPIRLAARGREPRWSRDGRELFFRDQEAVYSLPIAEANGTLTAGTAVELFRGEFDTRPLPRANYDVMPDGRFLMLRRTQTQPSQAIILSLNWRDRRDKSTSFTASR